MGAGPGTPFASARPTSTPGTSNSLFSTPPPTWLPQKYRCRPQPVELPAPAASAGGRQPYILLDRLLQQGPQGQLGAAAPPLLDMPLPQSGGQADADATAPSSLRQELEQLAADCFHADGSDTAVASGFVSLRDLAPAPEPSSIRGGGSSDTAARPAVLRSHLAAAPIMVRLEEPPPAARVPSFLLPPSQPPAPAADASAGPAAAAGGSTHHLCLLEPPVLPATAAVRSGALLVGAPTSAFSHLFQPLPVPEAAAGAAACCFVPEGCQPVSLADLVAQDMVLDDGGGLVLPAVQVEEPGEAESAGGCWPRGLQEAAREGQRLQACWARRRHAHQY